MRIGERGEVQVKGPGVFLGYYKQDEATRDAMTADGWLKTGDAGLIDPRGHLAIIDRAKDVGKLADGTPFAPQFIENKLKFSPYIREAVAFGDQRPFVAAMVAIDMSTVGKWAEQRSLPYTSFMDLRPSRRWRGSSSRRWQDQRHAAGDDQGRAHRAAEQGARRRRRGDDAHPQGAARVRGGEVCAR